MIKSIFTVFSLGLFTLGLYQFATFDTNQYQINNAQYIKGERNRQIAQLADGIKNDELQDCAKERNYNCDYTPDHQRRRQAESLSQAGRFANYTDMPKNNGLGYIFWGGLFLIILLYVSMSEKDI